ncbi:hypothetical protein [Klebsiella pneumoniae]|uniref:hypothetical protein n=1 Tax=Klebsiella pneumoniae TaxID=573 RepID=UPI001BDF7320|nr:hypothetical protein [Klebsiella pneumoniae]MBT1613118.1 hypothetical protein [Klebsiella pneumoniae]
MTDITELALIKGQKVEAPYYLVECDCGKIYPSSELSGGEPMGDSGDYSDCYCPHCGEGEEHFAECADPETAWKAQQDKIDALVEALEKAQQRIAELDIKNCELDSLTQRWAVERAENADRIAELESRTVTVKLPEPPGPMSVGARTVYFGIVADVVSAFQYGLTAAGIKVEVE